MEDRTGSGSEGAELERSENVTIVAETFSGGRAPTATVSSLKSEDSTERLICKTPQKITKSRSTLDRHGRNGNEQGPDRTRSTRSLEASAGSDDGKAGRRRLVVLLGLSQVVLGAMLVGGGATAVVRGAALSRVGSGLWAGCVAVVAGVVGVLAGINDCYGLNAGNQGRSPLLTAFLALSLLCLACGNSAAVLAATGLHRDYLRSQPEPGSTPERFQDEMEAWTPVLTNIALLIVATVHCLVSVLTIYHLSKRICPCFRPKQPFDHNQFDPNYKTLTSANYIVHVDENAKKTPIEKNKEQKVNHELCKDLEKKLANDTSEKVKKKKVEGDYGSSNSKEKLVSSWLGRHQTVLQEQERRPGRVRKYKMKPQPVMLVPAHPASTLGRMPVGVIMPPPRYATLPLPPPHYAPPPAPLYYPVHDARIRRRRSPREHRVRRRRDAAERDRDSQLTRSLERIHRKRRAERERMSDTELRRTYTGLDRAYAEQFIAVCDESRSHAGAGTDRHDSLTSTGTGSGSSDLTNRRHRDSF